MAPGHHDARSTKARRMIDGDDLLL